MFLASKLHDMVPMSAELLISYTDNSLSFEELISWELLLLDTLGWEVSGPNPLQYLDHLLQGIPSGSSSSNRSKLAPSLVEKVRQHTECMILLCVGEYQFLSIPPSLVATAALLSALRDLSTSNANLLKSTTHSS